MYIYIHSNCYSIFLRFTFGPFTRMPVGNDPVPIGSTFSQAGKSKDEAKATAKVAAGPRECNWICRTGS